MGQVIRAIKLMTDYHCPPLWADDDVEVGPLDHDEFPLSPELKSALWDWAATYDRTLNQENPRDSGFSSDAERSEFDREGRRLWRALQQELPNVVVSYFSVRDYKLHR